MAREEKLLAVLIDADNLSSIDAEAILKEITRYGEPALRRVYGDWSSDALSGWKREVKNLGLVARQETANTVRKNATDIGLVIDAMDILHSGRYDGFVLVTGDSDFTALANRLREDGVEVIGIGKKGAAISLRNVCNRFVFIENIVDTEKSVRQVADPKRKTSGSEENTDLISLIDKAMRNIDPDGEWYSLGQLGQYIVRVKPDFDPRTFGSPKLSDLITKTEGFEVRKGKGSHLEARSKS